MNKEKILNKIRKCLALSESSNTNEAATALKQAQKLMAEHGLSLSDVELSKVSQSEASDTLPIKCTWQVALASLINYAFGVKTYQSYKIVNGELKSRFIFYGLEHRAEIASYAFSVLLRQLKVARRQFLKNLVGVSSGSKRKVAADYYCYAWIKAAGDNVIQFAQTEQENKLMEEYTALINVKQSKSRKAKLSGESFAAACLGVSKGREDGKNVHIHHGVGGYQEPKGIGY